MSKDSERHALYGETPHMQLSQAYGTHLRLSLEIPQVAVARLRAC